MRTTHDWTELTDTELLQVRFKDLGLRLRGTPLQQRLSRVYGELERRGLNFRPHMWLAEEWFSPDGVPGIAVPFYLAHPRLMRLERRMMREVEGGNQNWMMRILRHEVGHAIDTAYRLRRRARWRELFGPPLGVAAARQHRGETVLALFDYGTFTALYEAVIHDVARFDAGIEVLTQNQHFRINYDTPYVRNLPTRLEITTSDLHTTGTETVGPFYDDAFRTELDAFHHAVRTGERPKTMLADSLADLELFAEVGRLFLSQ